VISAEALVSVKQIDGAETAVVKKGAIYYLRPGKHELYLFVGTITMKEARQYFQIDALADREYCFHAMRKDRDFMVELTDETDPKAVKTIVTIKMPAGAATLVPIPIPVK